MPDPTLISEELAPAWSSLTPEQRTCWHFSAMKHPVLGGDGSPEILFGYQYHYNRNGQLAVVDPDLMLTDPPPTHAPPQQVAIVSVAWPLGSQITGTTTARQGFAWLELDDPLPAETAVIVTQGYYRNLTNSRKTPRIRHVTVIEPLGSGTISLIMPSGYFATTAGANKYATIKGIRAMMLPQKPLGTIKVVNVTTGQTIRQILANPNGGTSTGINRPRATSYNPDAGVNHYP